VNLIDKYANEIRMVSDGFEEFQTAISIDKDSWRVKFFIDYKEYAVRRWILGCYTVRYGSNKQRQFMDHREVNAFLRKETGK